MISTRSLLLVAFALSSVSGRALAQSPTAEIALWPGVAGFATRGFVPDAHAGAIAVAFDAANVRGLGGGSRSVPGVVEGFRATVQNQDASRAMSFSIAVVADHRTMPGTPDLGAVLVQTVALDTPVEGSHAAAHRMTVTFATPASVLPQQLGWHLVLRFPSGRGSSVLYLHAAADRIGAVGDNARRDAPSLAQSFDVDTQVTRDLQGRSFDLTVITPASVLTMGADIDPSLRRGPNPCFGRAGTHPSRSRADGVGFRVQTVGVTSGMVVVLGTPLGFAHAPIALDGIAGEVLLTLPLMPSALLVTTIPQSGIVDAVSPRAPHPFHVPFGTVQFQAIVVPDLGWPSLTNAVAVHDGN